MNKFSIGDYAPAPQTHAGGKNLKAFLAFVGLIGGVVAAVYTYTETSEWALALYVVVMVSYIVGRGLGDVITEPHKVKRTIFFAIPAITATAVLVLTHTWFGVWWLAVLLGLFVGAVLIGGVLDAILFPGIAKEEAEDSAARTKRQFDL